MNVNYQSFFNLIEIYAPKVIGALVVLLIGLWIVNRIVGLIDKYFTKKAYEETLTKFLVSLANVLLKVILFISVAQMVGVETTSFVAILGAAGLAVGLALQGSLGNFAGSVLLLIFRPFKVGDVIEAQGELGVVKEIQMFCTILRSLDNKKVIIPNGPLAGGIVKNLSAEDTRRVDLVFGIGYGDDIKKAKELLLKITSEDTRVLTEPKTVVAVSELGDSSVNFVCRPWVKTEDYWDFYFDTVEKVKLEFDKNGISIPFPQRDVHIYNEKN